MISKFKLHGERNEFLPLSTMAGCRLRIGEFAFQTLGMKSVQQCLPPPSFKQRQPHCPPRLYLAVAVKLLSREALLENYKTLQSKESQGTLRKHARHT